MQIRHPLTGKNTRTVFIFFITLLFMAFFTVFIVVFAPIFRFVRIKDLFLTHKGFGGKIFCHLFKIIKSVTFGDTPHDGGGTFTIFIFLHDIDKAFTF
ncbi:hypothetical protein BGP_0126 [Beggiatoa sp. PS]|nr:hypothetical protein BGP_0126 [Beggiatoa sp. PS]